MALMIDTETCIFVVLMIDTETCILPKKKNCILTNLFYCNFFSEERLIKFIDIILIVHFLHGNASISESPRRRYFTVHRLPHEHQCYHLVLSTLIFSSLSLTA